MSTRFSEIIVTYSDEVVERKQVAFVDDGTNIWYENEDYTFRLTRITEGFLSGGIEYSDTFFGSGRVMFSAMHEALTYMKWRIQRHFAIQAEMAMNEVFMSKEASE